MNIKVIKKVLLWLSVAIGGTIIFLGEAGDGLGTSAIVAEYLLKTFGIPVNTIHTILLIVLIILILTLVLIQVKSIWGKDAKSFLDTDEKRARRMYLQWIKKDIDNRLNSSIHRARYIDLRLKETYKLVTARNYTFYKSSDGSESTIQTIDHLITTRPFSYLLLGAPGAGKTTMLLNCVNQSIAEADNNNNIPVFINLSKWGKKDGITRLFTMPAGRKDLLEENIISSDFDKWLIKIILGIKRTGLTKDMVKCWLETQQMTLFLDGLDEADETVRGTIVDKINAFLDKYPSVSVLISSRLADYEALVNTSKVKLELDGAVTIHPLTPEQINKYLDAAGTPQLQDLLDKDEELKEMARSPLELSIMVLAIRYTDFNKLLALKTHSITTKRITLFDAYVKAMVQREQLRRRKNPEYHDSDFSKIPVPEDRLSSLYKNLGWIARILCMKSISSFSPGRVYEYLTERGVSTIAANNYSDSAGEWIEDKSPRHYINIVTSTLLILCLSLLVLCYMSIYPLIILVLVIAVFLSLFFIENREVKFMKPRTRKIILSIIYWLTIMAVVPFIYIPFDYLFTVWKPVIWLIVIIFSITYLIISYLDLYKEKRQLLHILNNIPIWKHFANFTIALLPILYLRFNEDSTYNQWFLIGLVAILVSVFQFIFESVHLRKLIFYNLYAVSAAIAGMLIFKNHAGLNTLVIMLLTMTIAMDILGVEINSYSGKSGEFYRATAVFLGTLLGALTGLVFPPLIMFLNTLSIILVLMVLGMITYGGRLYEQGFAWLGSHIFLINYKLQRRIPLNYRKFLHYSTRALLLKKNKAEYEFIHRRIRDYFAIREYMPLLEEESVKGRVVAIRMFSRLKDASCDVLLEMIDDHDKDIRTGCLTGLGEIGTVIAAKSLLEAIEKTSGELKDLAIDQLSKIKDIAAIPVLIRILNSSSVDSRIFDAALTALTSKLRRLSVWENEEKMKAYLNHNPFSKYADIINFILSNKEISRLKTRIELIINNCLTNKGSNLTHKYHLLHKTFCNLTNDELLECIQHKDNMVARIALRLLYNRGQIKLAVEALLQTKWSDLYFNKNQLFSNADLKKIAPVLIDIVKTNNEQFLQATFSFLQVFKVPEMEEIILQASDNYDIYLKQGCLMALERIATKRSIPFLLAALQEEELSYFADRVLSQFKTSMLKTLIKDKKNSDVCDQLIHIYSRKPIHSDVTFLIEMLEQDNPPVQCAVINTLRLGNVKNAIPLLLRLFDQKNEKTLKALINALTAMHEKRIIPDFPELFWKCTWLQPTILFSLMRFEANREIVALYEAFAAKNISFSELDETLQMLFVEYFASIKERNMVIDLIYPLIPSNNRLLMPSEKLATKGTDNDTLYNEISEIVKKYFLIGDNLSSLREIRQRPKEEGNDSINCLLRPGILKLLGFSVSLGSILDIIYRHDAALSRELATDFIQNNNHDITEVLGNKLMQSTNTIHRTLLIIIIGSFKLKSYGIIKHLRSYLDGQQDDNIKLLAIKALGHLEDDYSLNKFLSYLKSSNKEIVKMALEAIVALGETKSVKIDNLLELISQSSHLQILLTNPIFASILNQLSIPEIHKMGENQESELRYLAAIYSGILGHGKLIGLLNDLLNDTTPINIFNEHEHTTVYHGALYSLNRIGTPSAKSYVDNWLHNRSSA